MDCPAAFVPEGVAGGHVVVFVSRVLNVPLVVDPAAGVKVTNNCSGRSASPAFFKTVAIFPIVTLQAFGEMPHPAP